MGDRFNLSAWGLRNGALTLFAMLVLAAAGAWSYLGLGRAEDPSFTLKSMVVSAAWPGASAEEMQSLVADRIESRLQDLRSLDVLRTYVRPGVTVVTVQLRDDTPPRDVLGLWYEVRKKVGDIRPLLPSGVVGPAFDDEYSDVFSVVLALTGTNDNAELVRQAEAIRLRLLRLPGVEKVVIGGERPQRVFVEAPHARLATLGLPPTALLDALARRNPLAPAGSVEGGSTRLALRVDAGLDGLASVRATPVAAPDGRTLRLADVAEVRRGFEDPPPSRILHRGQEAVTISVAKRAGWDVARLGGDVARELLAIRASLPAGLALEEVSNQARIVRDSIAEFLLKFAAALGVVMLVSFAALGIRAGLVVALSVPLTLAATFLLMRGWGMELERISLGALILALGLLVDDAIIAVEAMVVKLERGWERAQAAAWTWGHTAAPMLVGTLVTVAGFIPVGFARSVAGEYAGGIFWVVGAALVASWVVAVWFIPYLGAKLLPAPRWDHVGGHGGGEEGRAARGLRRAVRWSVRRRAPVLLAAVALLGAGGAGMALTRKQFFPSSQRLELLVDVGLRGGAPLAATEAAVREVERFLDGEGPDAALRTAYLGAGAPRFFLALDPDLPNEANAKIVIQTPSEEARERLRARLLDFAASGAAPEARVRVSRLDFGPPVGFPVQFRVVGPDLAALRPVADGVLAAVRGTPGTRDAQVQGGERAPNLRVALDQERVAQLGLSPDAVSRSLAVLLTGAPATQLREGTRLVDVVLRAPEGERLAAGSLGDLSVWTAAGPVPLAQVARLVPGTEEPIAWRRNRDAVLTVRADLRDGLQGPDVTAAALPRVAAVRAAGLPEGVRIETGGAVEESAKANAALYGLFPLMVAAMWVLLMAQLRHWGRAALVFATAPLGVPGAAAALLLLDRPFGFVALLGVIALAGMVMRNTLILVDQVRQDLEEGLPLEEAIVGSTVRRARPVLLTALAAVLAFVPLTHSAFWGPMAVAMIGGLLVATAATLLVVPALYALALPRRQRRTRGTGEVAPLAPPLPRTAIPVAHPAAVAE